MTACAGPAESSTEPGLADGFRAVRLTVLVFLVLDIVTSRIGQAFGVTDLGRADPLAEVQRLLLLGAAATTLWNRPRTALLLIATVVTLVFTVRPTGEELWLVLITAVTAGIRCNGRQLALVVLAQAGYAAGFGWRVAQTYPGEGWSTALLVLGFAAGALLVGLAARWLFRARDRRRRRVEQLEQEQAAIRALERARLADELQVLVTEGLVMIEAELRAAERPPVELGRLRSSLAAVGSQSSSLLAQLRILLDVLRQDAADVAARASQPGAAQQRWVDLITARHVRMAVTAVCGLLAVDASVVSDGLRDPTVLAQAIGWLACAVAVWRPAAGACCAAGVLLACTVLGPAGFWDVLSTTLLCWIAGLRFRPRVFWSVVLGVAGYAGLLTAGDSPDRVDHVLLLCLTAFGAVGIGLTTRHFVTAREDSLRRLADVMAEHDRIESTDRTALARELHDVVAHSLSLASMLVMATSLSDDPEKVAATVGQVRRSTEAAHQELITMLHALRGPSRAAPGPGPLITPLASASALAQRLSEHGYRPAVDLDPAANALDPTTQRTLSRIMQEATTNILRYTPAGSSCRFTLAVDDSRVRLLIASPLADSERSSDLSLGWGLRGVRERVELTHGTFAAGSDSGQWVLAVTLPTSVEAASGSAPGATGAVPALAASGPPHR